MVEYLMAQEPPLFYTGVKVQNGGDDTVTDTRVNVIGTVRHGNRLIIIGSV